MLIGLHRQSSRQNKAQREQNPTGEMYREGLPSCIGCRARGHYGLEWGRQEAMFSSWTIIGTRHNLPYVNERLERR